MTRMGTTQFEDYISEVEDSLEHFEDGEMAETTARLDNRVIKVLSDRKGREHIIPNILDPFEPMFSKENKAQRIADITEAQEDFSFSFPEVIHRNKEYMELEYVEGVEMSDYLQDARMDVLEDLSYRMGEQMSELHEEGWALRDFNLDNIIVEDSEEENFYIVDAELSKSDPKTVDKIWDVASFLYNAEPGTQERYNRLSRNFCDSYGIPGYIEKPL
ncbi:MAG: hypothetical protein ABEJ72_07420, partial [Candidatus Aenigmatarchaeota archaeon]